MPRKPKEIATGTYEPVKDKNGKQVIDPKRGPKWKIRVELPRVNGKRRRKNLTVYGSEWKARLEKERFVAEINRNLSIYMYS